MIDGGIMIDDPMMIWCAKHLEPYRTHWPVGYLPSTMCLVHQALSKDEEITAAFGGRIAAITPTLREYGPLCCRYPEVTAEIVGFIDADEETFNRLIRKYSWEPKGGWTTN